MAQLVVNLSPQQIKRNYFWNTLSSLMNAAASVLMLVVVTRTLSIGVSGIFALAFALAQQFQVIGAYEVRTYQATDLQERYSFVTYFAARLATCTIMIAALVIYAFVSQRVLFAVEVVILVGSLRLFDAFEDVIHGRLQQIGRLDLAGIAFFIRIVATTASFMIAVVLTKNLIASCLISFACSLVALFACNTRNFYRYGLHYDEKGASGVPTPGEKDAAGVPTSGEKGAAGTVVAPKLSVAAPRGLKRHVPSWKNLIVQSIKLLITCAALFGGSFLMQTLINNPRLGIQAYFSSAYQAYYSIIFMPVAVIALLSGFVFKPLLTHMALYWEEKSPQNFSDLLKKGFAFVGLITLVVIVLAWFLGTPVLSLVYRVNVNRFRPELMVMLVGGGFNALSIILFYALVTMRRQAVVLIGYAIAAVFSFVSVFPLVKLAGIMGAALVYTLSLVILVAIFCLTVYVGIRHKKRRTQNT